MNRLVAVSICHRDSKFKALFYRVELIINGREIPGLGHEYTMNTRQTERLIKLLESRTIDKSVRIFRGTLVVQWFLY